MGCGTLQEKLEDQMMAYKLERMEIQMEKEKELKKLAEIEGHTVERGHVPDYIDPEFAREKKLYPELIDNNKDNNKDKSKEINKEIKRVEDTDHLKKKRKFSKKNTEETTEKKRKKKK